MINFYQAWKDDKDSEPKRKRPKPANRCKICGKAVNGLKDHVRGNHGADMWERYLAAEKAVEEQQRRAFLEAL